MIDGIVDWIASVLGEYSPVVYELTTVSGEENVAVSEVVASGLAGVDWQYITAAALLVITVYSFFRLMGILLEKL